MRTTQVFINDEWISIDNMKVKKGMKFRMFEPDGTPAHDSEEWIATSDAYYNEDGIGTINIS